MIEAEIPGAFTKKQKKAGGRKKPKEDAPKKRSPKKK